MQPKNYIVFELGINQIKRKENFRLNTIYKFNNLHDFRQMHSFKSNEIYEMGIINVFKLSFLIQKEKIYIYSLHLHRTINTKEEYIM